jgi:hypothetical protein
VRFGLYADDKEEDQKNLHGALKLYMKNKAVVRRQVF